MSLTFTIVPRVQSRCTTYNVKDIVGAIQRAGLQFNRPNWLITVHVNTLDERRALEYNLKLVHRNVAYKIDPTN